MPPGTIFSLVVLVVFIFGAFYARSFILKRMSGQTRGILGNRNITVLEHFAIAKDRSFCLVKTAGKVYFVAFAAGAVTVLDTFDADTFSQEEAEALAKNSVGVGGGSTGSNFGVPSKLVTGNSPYARMTRALARFFANKMGRKLPYEDKPSESFADTLKASSEKDRGDKSNTSDEPEEEA